MKAYDRQKAVDYAVRWAVSRNPAFYDFEKIGGDCTNFASQCLYAGSGVMNWTPVTGWYYISAGQRTPSWTSVEFLYRFLTSNLGPGPYARVVGPEAIQPGDLVQLGTENGTFYHSPVVLERRDGEIYVAAHSYDTLWKPLSGFSYDQVRYLHIEYVRE